MVSVTFVQQDGVSSVVDAEAGQSLMVSAVINDVAGILAECGGSCICGTCHVQFSEQDFARLPKIDSSEEALLGTLGSRVPTSRLACQIEVTDDLDGLIVHVVA